VHGLQQPSGSLITTLYNSVSIPILSSCKITDVGLLDSIQFSAQRAIAAAASELSILVP